MRRIIGAITAGAVIHFCSCNGNDTDTVPVSIDPETTPTMLTHDVSTLISDSGYTRYHLQAPVWYVFGEANNSRWSFPDGVFLEKFDDFKRREATVECDSATYFDKRRLWRLDGNVRILNVQGERFLTEQLFWDQRAQRVYSDSFIHIERHDRIIEGYGFNSNDRLTEYEVNRVSGIFPVDQFRPGQQQDSASATPPSDTSAPDSGPAPVQPDTASGPRPVKIVRPRRHTRPDQPNGSSAPAPGTLTPGKAHTPKPHDISR